MVALNTYFENGKITGVQKVKLHYHLLWFAVVGIIFSGCDVLSLKSFDDYVEDVKPSGVLITPTPSTLPGRMGTPTPTSFQTTPTLTPSSTVTSSPLSSSTPKLVFPKATVGYNIIENGDFSLALSGWDTSIDLTAGASQVSFIENETLKVSISNPGVLRNDIIYKYDDLYFEIGKNYQFSFKARATKSRHIRAFLYVDDIYWRYDFGDILIKEGTDFENYNFSFTAINQTTFSSYLALCLGNFEETNDITDIYFDDISLMHVEPTPAASPTPPINWLLNGDFEKKANVGWKGSWPPTASATPFVISEDGKRTLITKIDQTNIGTTEDALTFWQPFVYLQAGKKYTLTFNTRAQHDKYIKLVIRDVAMEGTLYKTVLAQSENIMIKKSFDGSFSQVTWSFTFTADNTTNFTGLEILLGNFGETFQSNDVYFDDFKLIIDEP